MKAKEIETLEGFFKTENEHWNQYALEMFCEILKQNNFENPETPLQIFDKGINIFTEQYKTPLRAVQLFGNEADLQQLNPGQKLFVYEWVYKYLRASEFGEIDINEIKELLKSQIARLKNDIPKIEYNKPLTGNIRDTLKEIMQKEIESLPEILKELEPLQRLNVVCKLIPFVLPKIESVTHTQGEPDSDTENNAFKW